MCDDMIIRRFAGGFVLASLALGHWVSPWFLLFTAFDRQAKIQDFDLPSRIDQDIAGFQIAVQDIVMM